MATGGRPGRPKGLPKTGGRKKGVPNKTPSLRSTMELVNKHKEEGIDGMLAIKAQMDPRLVEELGELHGAAFFRVYLEVCSFIYAKPRSVEINGTVSTVSDVTAALRALVVADEAEIVED